MDIQEQWTEYCRYLAETDNRAKNSQFCIRTQGKIPKEPYRKTKIEWYKPYKHKLLLIKIFHSSMLSGYETDKHFVITDMEEPVLQVRYNNLIINITNSDYCKVWDEAKDSFDLFCEQFFQTSKDEPIGRVHEIKVDCFTIKHVNFAD